MSFFSLVFIPELSVPISDCVRRFLGFRVLILHILNSTVCVCVYLRFSLHLSLSHSI